MRTPPVLMGAAALVLLLGACNDKPTDSERESPDRTEPALVPFESTVPETKSRETDPPETDPPDTEADSSDSSDSSDDTDEADDTEVQAIDPMPGDTAVFDTRPADDPLCAAAQDVLDANDDYQDVLAKAINVADDATAMVKALKKLPLEDLRNAYDDLAAEVTTSLRRKVALIRDFTLEHGEELLKIEDVEGLSELIAATEADPDATKVTKATLAVSEYTEEECGIKLSEGR